MLRKKGKMEAGKTAAEDKKPEVGAKGEECPCSRCPSPEVLCPPQLYHAEFMEQ